MLCACSLRSALHFDLGVEQACSAAARVLLASPSRTPPSSCSSWFGVSFVRGVSSRRGAPPADPRSCGSALPSSASTSSFLSLPMRKFYLFGGGRMSLPVRDCRWLPGSHSISPRICPVVPRSRFAPGRPDVFSWPGLRTSSTPLLHSSLSDRFLVVHIVRACCGQTLRLGLVGAPALV